MHRLLIEPHQPASILGATRERGCEVQPATLTTDHPIASMPRFFGFDQGDRSAEAVTHVMAVPAPNGATLAEDAVWPKAD